MNLRLSKGQLHSASIEAISSKSFVHRLLIAASLSDSSVTINTNIISKDMEATVGVLRALGASIDVYEDKFVVNSPVLDTIQNNISLDCIESGSTARFIMPIAALRDSEITMTGQGKLPQRPFTELTDVLINHGAVISDNHLPLTLKGPITPGEYEIPGNVSSQYISGLLFALPLLDKPSRLTITTNLESSGYVDMTLDVLKTFGITINRSGNVFDIPGGQKYHGPRNIDAEGDWSNGAYLLTLAKVANMLNPDINIRVTGLNDDSLQKDRAIKDIINSIKNENDSIDVDCSEIPDIVPAIAVLCSCLNSSSMLRNVERLRIKESDRIESTCALIGAIGAKCDVIKENNHENLMIKGSWKDLHNIAQNGIIIDSFNDHRIVMAAAIASLLTDETVIKDALAINKSYPGFFEALSENLGMLVAESK